jgi:hypothetical protein
MKKIKKIVAFYLEGFQNLSPWSRTLWAIILIKLFVMFVIFRLFFFQNVLKTQFDNDEERANHVIEQITTP